MLEKEYRSLTLRLGAALLFMLLLLQVLMTVLGFVQPLLEANLTEKAADIVYWSLFDLFYMLAFMLPVPFYVMPLADHAGGEEGIRKMLENGTLEVIPLGHLRGRSLRNSIVFCTECENLTRQHIQLLMGRIDDGSQLWLDGDTKQRDRAIFEQSAGLERMVDRLAGNKLFAHIHLEKSERSEVAALADLLDD